MFSKILNFLNSAINLVLRIMDWRKSTKRDRALDEANRAIAEHDRQTVNRIIRERSRRRDD